MDSLTLQTLDAHLDFFKKMYDAVRLVDPVAKKVVEQRGVTRESPDETCFHYWQDQKICDNCISIRAHQQGTCFIKLESAEEFILLVTSLPIIDAGNPLVLELLKNATKTMMIGKGTYSSGHFMHEYIQAMNEQIISDPLTGVYNRRFIDERLPAEIVRTMVEGHTFSVIFLDVDNFKQINDTLGHIVGDQVIQSIARMLVTQVRDGLDWVARYGGDEFLIFLHNTPPKIAFQIAERIRTKIANLNESTDLPTAFTVSMGLYTQGLEALDAQEIIRLVDRRLYKAKQLGKNRICGEL